MSDARYTYWIMPEGHWNLWWRGYDWELRYTANDCYSYVASGSALSRKSAMRQIEAAKHRYESPERGWIKGVLE